MTATLPTYSGYANKATWLVALWLDNEPYTSEELQRIANAGDEYTAAKNLQSWVEELCEPTTGPSSLASDLLGWALAYVEWREIVESHREEEEEEPHTHAWGPVEFSRFSGNPHRSCPCGAVSLDLDDEDEDEENA